MVRLINSVKGFDDVFEFNLEQYEYDKARVFNQINNLLDVTVLDDFLNRLENIINWTDIDISDVSNDDMLNILKDYSKTERMLYNASPSLVQRGPDVNSVIWIINPSLIFITWYQVINQSHTNVTSFRFYLWVKGWIKWILILVCILG